MVHRFGYRSRLGYQRSVHSDRRPRAQGQNLCVGQSGSLTQIKLTQHLAALRPCSLHTPDDSIRHTLRSLAKRWLALDSQSRKLAALIEGLVTSTPWHLIELFGIGVGTAVDIVTVVGDNLERMKSEPSVAKLGGISSIPASSGTTTGRWRMNHGGHCQLDVAIHPTVVVRMRFHESTIAYVTRRTAERMSKRDILRVPQALCHPRDLPPDQSAT